MLDPPKVYLESTIPSYLTARPSKNLQAAAAQQATHWWWENRREDYELFVSELVVDECGRGDPDAAARRLEIVGQAKKLPLDYETRKLAEQLFASNLFPPKAEADIGHIAVAARHKVEYLLSWNCRHIANPDIIPYMAELVNDAGYPVPAIYTPFEFSGGLLDEE